MKSFCVRLGHQQGLHFLIKSRFRSGNQVRYVKSETSTVEPQSKWSSFLTTLFLTGSISGPLLDSIHSRTYLQIYDSLPINITSYGLDFHSSFWVSPLLGLFYAVLGILTHQTWSSMIPLGSLHRLLEKDDPPKDVNWGYVALSFGALAAGLELSALLYENGVPYVQIHVILATYSCINWYLFDRTKQGVILAAICAIGSPLGELPILLWFKWWHYSQPDFFSLLPSWVIWCYFFYTPSVRNLAEKLKQSS